MWFSVPCFVIFFKLLPNSNQCKIPIKCYLSRSNLIEIDLLEFTVASSQVWQYTPAIPTTLEAEAGEFEVSLRNSTSAETTH